MRIGIVTIWGTDENYGAVLQCYALQKYLKSFGHDPYLIRYQEKRPKNYFRGMTPLMLSKYIARKLIDLFTPSSNDKPRYFDLFENKYLSQTEKIYYSYQELKEDPPEADLYIVGSDQVWNFYNAPLSICRDRIHAFFLDFGSEKVLRASYAASWDKSYVSEDELKEIKPLMKHFDYVSVREQSGLDLCRECEREHAEWVPDPTLLLSADEYRMLYDSDTEHKWRRDKDYVLLYIVLSTKKDFSIKSVFDFASKRNLDVVYVTGNRTNNPFSKSYPTIPEWVYLMDKAKYVITNSFHGTAFSLIFHKQYATVPLNGYASATNARIESLCKMMQTETRFLQNNDFSILDKEYKAKILQTNHSFDKFLAEAGNHIAGG